jgi:hypothetical protein
MTPYKRVLVASKNVQTYNNLILVNFLINNGVNGDMQVLDKAYIPIIQPIKLSEKPFFIPIEGNKGDNIENPIPLKVFMHHKMWVIFIFNIYFNLKII